MEVEIIRWDAGEPRETLDSVVDEEPLEIRINGESLAVTMRTPGDDFALACGLLLAEGIIRSMEDVGSVAYCLDVENPDLRNIVNVLMDPEWKSRTSRTRWERSLTSTSSCGLCGKASIESVRQFSEPLPDCALRVSPEVIATLSDRMRAEQRIFARTGGLHAAALFDPAGTLLSLREDVGRHNAVDKLIGTELLGERLPLSERVMMVSGRTSFEIMQKAAVARIPVVCAVSAPSSLAVELARDLNLTLVGFVRGSSMNVYSSPGRVAEGKPGNR